MSSPVCPIPLRPKRLLDFLCSDRLCMGIETMAFNGGGVEGGGGSLCRMSIIRKGNVALSIVRNSHVSLSIVRNSHGTLSILRNSHKRAVSPCHF